MKSLLKLTASTLVLVLATTAGSALGTTLTFQQGGSNSFVENYDGTSDTVLASNVAMRNGGAFDYFSVGRSFTRRALLRFDLSVLSGSVGSVESATLTLHLGEAMTSSDLTINVYRVSAANAGWLEGSGVLAETAASGEATWGHLAYGLTPWSGSPGASTAGVDYEATPVATFTWKSSDTAVTLELPPELVYEWISRPAENGGLLFVASNGAGVNMMTANFASSENASMELRPQLTFEYSAIPEPKAALLLLGMGIAATGCRRVLILLRK